MMKTRLASLFCFSISSISCVTNRRSAIITNVSLTENILTVDIEKNGKITFTQTRSMFVFHDNPTEKFLYDLQIEEVWHARSRSTVRLTIDLTKTHYTLSNPGRTLLINENAELEITLAPGKITANIFIGDGRIDILEQHYNPRRSSFLLWH
ncbi:MAG: hypothetical protein LBH44_05080 [Treponema sp.]|nr:hypothetical protein [Treponema sp.]